MRRTFSLQALGRPYILYTTIYADTKYILYQDCHVTHRLQPLVYFIWLTVVKTNFN